jgi:spermidine/putrescine transport system substrate-binding protein
MSRFVVLFPAFMGALLIAFTGCTKSGNGSATDAKAPLAPKTGEKEVNLAIWGTYLPDGFEDKFFKDTGIKVKLSHYASNEELLAKIQAGAGGIDVAIPSDYMVDVLTKLQLIQPLDKSLIPNASGLDPQFLKQSYDPENKYSLPYAWSTAGIAINRDLYKGELKSWKDVFSKKDLAGKISLLDDVREVTGAALKANGFSVNSTKPDELAKAQATLKDFRPRLKMFRSETIDPLVNKEIAVAQVYSVDGLRANRKAGGNHIEYKILDEGGTKAIDNMVILKSAKNVQEAHVLINYFLKPETNLAFVETVLAGPVLLSTKAKLPKELSVNSALFPSKETMNKLESIHDVGEATRLYDRLWTELKTE